MLFDILSLLSYLGFLGGADSKESIFGAGDLGSIPRLGKFPGGGQGNPLQILAWRIPMGRGPQQATNTPWGHKELNMTE